MPHDREELPFTGAEVYGDWVIDAHTLTLRENQGLPLVFHRHDSNNCRPIFLLADDGICRLCNAEVPKGILFRVSIFKLKAAR